MKKRPKFRKGPNQTVLTIYLTCVICGHQHFYHRDTFFLDSGQNYLKKKLDTDLNKIKIISGKPMQCFGPIK